MSERIYDVAGLGSPLVDFTIQVDDEFLKGLGLTKGHMHLIDEQKSKDIFAGLKNYKIEVTPGGSAANTLAGVTVFGGTGILFGTVGNDSNADFYVNETKKTGIIPRLEKHNSMTGHAITFITPDSERTFATHLGAAQQFRKNNVIEDDIKKSSILHIEGFLLEVPEIREAVMHAISIAKANDVKISVDLADPALIGRIPEVMKSIVNDHCHIVFVNEQEALAFTGKEEENALNAICEMCDIAVVKLGGAGSLIKTQGNTCRIPAYKTKVINTNGAGDMYAAGLLYGLSRKMPIEKAGRIASYASSLVVSQVSTRLAVRIDPEKVN